MVCPVAAAANRGQRDRSRDGRRAVLTSCVRLSACGQVLASHGTLKVLLHEMKTTPAVLGVAAVTEEAVLVTPHTDTPSIMIPAHTHRTKPPYPRPPHGNRARVANYLQPAADRRPAPQSISRRRRGHFQARGICLEGRRVDMKASMASVVRGCGAVAVLVGSVVLGGCGSSPTAVSHPKGSDGTTTLTTKASPTVGSPTTTSPSRVTSKASEVPTASSLPPTTSVTTEPTPPTTGSPPPAPAPVASAGSLLQPPSTPEIIPAEADCHQLLTQPPSISTIRNCATATGPLGTVTATDEGYAHTQLWNVWRRVGNQAVLALQYRGNIQSTPGFVFHTADLAGDGYPKIVAVQKAPASLTVSSVDVIEESGRVVCHLPLGAGGVVGPANPPGLAAWTKTSDPTLYSLQIVRYQQGAWRLVQHSTVPANQVPAYPDHDGFGGGLP